MLNAILSGKAGRLDRDYPAGYPWREVVKLSEDILLDMIFSRLSYLNPPLFWKILNDAFQLHAPAYQMASQASIEFWPNWENATDDGVRVEPDCHVVFELGDPGRVVSVLIEAKLGDFGNPQTSWQWHREWQAYQQWLAEEGIEVDATYFLALGGLEHPVDGRMKNLRMEANSMGSELPAFGASWKKLIQTISNVAPTNSQDRRILDDVILALALAGHRSIRALEDLTPISQHWCSTNDFNFEKGCKI